MKNAEVQAHIEVAFREHWPQATARIQTRNKQWHPVSKTWVLEKACVIVRRRPGNGGYVLGSYLADSPEELIAVAVADIPRVIDYLAKCDARSLEDQRKTRVRDAGPVLLAALKGMLATFGGGCGAQSRTVAVNDVIAAALDAIAKAEGGGAS